MGTILFRLSLLILCFCCLKLNPCSGADRITATQSLSGDQTIVSAGGAFELGFFKPGKSENYYIGIWYKQVSPRTVVWVANRGSPVSNKFSSELRVSLNGCLALYKSSNVEIWSNLVSSAPHHSVQVVLLDDGNLVQLPNGSSPFPPNPPLWQSFDEPGDTWIPGSKIGFNKVTQRDISLTSWRNIEDPAPGPFLLKLGSNRSIELWKYYWPGHEWQRTLNFMNQFSYFDNQNETCLTYSQHKGSLISRYVLDPGGQIQLLSWQEFTKRWLVIWRQPAFLYEIDRYCGPYGSFTGESGSSPCRCLTGFVPASQVGYGSGAFYGGCYRSSPLRCDKTDWFWPIPVVRWPDNARISAAGSSKECESSCLSSCSCTAFSYNGTECSVWYVDLLNMRQDVPSGQTICIKLAAEEFPSSNHKKWIDVSCVVGSIVLLLVLVILVVFRRWRKQQKARHGKVMEGSLVAVGFTHKELKNATRNFAEKLGEGGFGSVYKGTLPDSSVVAVKKVEGISFGQAEKHKQFLAEVRTLGVIQHLNLVGFRGFTCDATRMLLVYDYMPNGSLACHLFHENESKTLDWKTRYNIALGTARGLGYLHEKCRECIFHCDIKPDNVLLDGEFQPKLADFGMAKLFGRDFSRVLTTLRGTIGYLAPEWISGEAITAKADVYSYGMMLFEVVSGRRNSQRHSCAGHYFPVWVATVVNEGGNVMELLDPRLDGNADSEEVSRICRVALWCIQDNESRRPTMSQVVYALERILEVDVHPIPRILHGFIDVDQDNQ